MTQKIICRHCKGNGYIRVTFEAEKNILQCKKCESQGTIKDEDWTHYGQTWKEPNGSTAYYHGPLLNPEDFKDWKISKE